MKALTINTALMSSMMMIIGCGSSKEAPVSLEVSGGFTITSAGYTGGLLAHGVGPNGAKFSASAGTGTTLNTKIVDGNWKIYVVGYDGAAAFSGTKYCGLADVTLGSTDSSINININAANCADPAFQSEVGIQNTFTTSCGGFYTYNQSTDSYSAISGDTFCSTLPTNLSQSHSHYKLVSLNASADGVTPGLATACLSTSSSSIVRREIPTKKFPFKVLTFPSLVECQNTTNAQVAGFTFPDGLNAGGSDFDHDFSVLSTNARLVLPSSMTRRGRSPFMNMIPNILCGSSATSLEECMNAPVANLSHVYVPFNQHNGGDGDKQVLLRGLARNSTIPAGFLGSMTKFNVSGLEIEDGSVFGKVSRNCFFCQASGEFGGLKDIYASNGKLYVLSSNGTDSWVKIYSSNGSELQKFMISGSVYNHVAAASDGTLYIANSSIVKKFTISSGMYNTTPAATHSGTSISGIELNSNGSEIVIAEYLSANTYLAAYLTTNLTTGTGTNRMYSSVLKQMQLVGNDLYFYDGSGFKKSSFSTGGLGTATALTNPTNSWEGFAINGTDVYGFTTINYRVERLSLAAIASGSTATSSTLSYNNSGTSPKQVLFFNNKVYLGDQDNNQLQIFETNLAATAQVIGNPCNETAVASVGATTESITFTTKPDDSIYRLLETAFESTGVRQIPDNKYVYAFREFKPHGLEVRSGGVLGQAQQMLGPDGIASFVSDFADCTTLKTALAAAPNMTITRSRTLPDISTGLNDTYTGVFKKISQNISAFYCKDNQLTGSCVAGTDIYDIEVTFYSTGSTDKEVSKMKLSCNRKVGSIESVEKESTQVRREFTTWNTGDYTNARYERYSVDVETQYRVQLQKLVRNGTNNLWSRSVNTNSDASYTNGMVKEFQIYSAKAMTRALNISDTTTNFLNDHASFTVDSILYNDIRDNTSFAGDTIAPLACASVSLTDMNTSNNCSATNFQTLTYTPMSDAPTLSVSIGDAVGVSDPNHDIWDVFTIPEP